MMGEALHPISPTLGEEVEEENDGDEEVGEGAQDQERVEAKTRKDPGLPSAEEVKRHNISTSLIAHGAHIVCGAEASATPTLVKSPSSWATSPPWGQIIITWG